MVAFESGFCNDNKKTPQTVIIETACRGLFKKNRYQKHLIYNIIIIDAHNRYISFGRI